MRKDRRKVTQVGAQVTRSRVARLRFVYEFDLTIRNEPDTEFRPLGEQEHGFAFRIGSSSVQRFEKNDSRKERRKYRGREKTKRGDRVFRNARSRSR